MTKILRAYSESDDKANLVQALVETGLFEQDRAEVLAASMTVEGLDDLRQDLEDAMEELP